jgi:hypothetical protein
MQAPLPSPCLAPNYTSTAPFLTPKMAPATLALTSKDAYLGTSLKYYQYIPICPTSIPQEVWDNSRHTIPISTNGYVYLKIRLGMYSLKEA